VDHVPCASARASPLALSTSTLHKKRATRRPLFLSNEGALAATAAAAGSAACEAAAGASAFATKRETHV
jgi:hypothetical protein